MIFEKSQYASEPSGCTNYMKEICEKVNKKLQK